MGTTASQRFALSMPKWLKTEVARLAEADGTSMTQWINVAIAHRVGGESSAEAFFKRLRESSDKDAMLAMLEKSQRD